MEGRTYTWKEDFPFGSREGSNLGEQERTPRREFGLIAQVSTTKREREREREREKFFVSHFLFFEGYGENPP